MNKATLKERRAMRLNSILKYKSIIEVFNREDVVSDLAVEQSEIIGDAHQKLNELGYDWTTRKVKPFKKWMKEEQTAGKKGWKPLEDEMKDVFG